MPGDRQSLHSPLKGSLTVISPGSSDRGDMNKDTTNIPTIFGQVGSLLSVILARRLYASRDIGHTSMICHNTCMYMCVRTYVHAYKIYVHTACPQADIQPTHAHEHRHTTLSPTYVRTYVHVYVRIYTHNLGSVGCLIKAPVPLLSMIHKLRGAYQSTHTSYEQSLAHKRH